MELGDDGKKTPGDVPEGRLILSAGGVKNHCVGCIEGKMPTSSLSSVEKMSIGVT